jgi:ATP-binding cassette subfamily F protein uup
MTVVSHDRYFLERVTDHVVALLGDEKLSFLPGGVEQYLDRVRGTREASLPATGGAVAGAGSPGSSGLDAAQERVARKELQRLERQIERLSQREAALGVEMAENASDYERLTKLGADLRAVQSEKAELEERWLSVAADLETGG